MIPQNWIDSTDLNAWANRRDAQARLPNLLRRLINATVQSVQKIGFLAGDSVQMGGWDGIVEVSEGNAFVPNGCSSWELTVIENSQITGKANRDYQKRCKEPLGISPSQGTFVFVSLRRWASKEKWIREKNSEGIWAEVRAFDADDLEQWLEIAPTVHVWLARLLGKWSDDVQDLDSFWDEWANVTSPSLTSSLHLAGREQNVKQVKEWLTGVPSQLTIQADSYEEAISFFAAIIYDMPEDERNQYISRCVLISNESSWRYFSSFPESLILIPTFNHLKLIPQGHYVLVPVGREISPSQAVQLLRLSREGFRKALISMSFSEERAYELSKESKRSLLVIRRLLAQNREIHTPNWAKPENVRALIPALLVGAWDENREADREVISALARQPYEEVINSLSQWLNTSDPPIRLLGKVWQLVSRDVTWHFLSRFLVPTDFEVLEKTALSVLGTHDPQYELPIDQRFSASVYGKELPHSSFLRQGLAETLAILSTQGLSSNSQDIRTAQERVNSIVHKLLNTDYTWQNWASLSSLLPILAEAAPANFLACVEKGLEDESPKLLGIFQESQWGYSPHTGLLWALETFAWEPNYLSRVAVIFAKLSRLDPGGKLINRPFNSLREIFLYWNPQTSALLKQRLRVIDNLLIREQEVTWKLLCSLLPNVAGGISHPIHKPRWRDWVNESQVSSAECLQNIDSLMQRILANVGNSSSRLCDVINKLEALPPNLRDQAIQFIDSIDITNIQDADLVKVWSDLRKVIYEHKKFSNTRWTMPDEAIEKLESIYQKLEPQNLTYRYSWLFSSCQPKILENIELGWEAAYEKVRQVQLKAVKEIYLHSGISDLIEMSDHVQQPILLGVTIAKLESIDNVELELLQQSLGTEKKTLNDLAIGFVRGRLEILGWDWVEKLIAFAKSKQWSKKQLISFFHGLPFEQRSWDLLFNQELETTYWKTIPADWVRLEDCEVAICQLLNVNRPYASVSLAGQHIERSGIVSIPPKILIKILEQAALIDPQKETPVPDNQSIRYHINDIFSALDDSESVTKNELLKLEWIYFSALHRSKRQPKLLYQEISTNPLFFVEIIKDQR